MASASVAAPRRPQSTRKSTKKTAKVHTLTPVPHIEPANEVVAHGKSSLAHAKGADPIAVAVGHSSQAVIDANEGSFHAAAVAVGSGCQADVNGEGIASVAVGFFAKAISSVPDVPSVGIGVGAYAEAPAEGTAITIGSGGGASLYPSCQAGEGGYLVFIDTDDREPKVAVFKIDPDQGIWPCIPYQWRRGWKTPCPDWERMDQEGFERGRQFQREHPDEK